MATVQFEPNVHYRSQHLLDLGLYPHIHVPAGVSAREPFFVSATEMQRLAPSDTIKIIAGLTVAEFSLRFPTPAMQWKQVRSGGALTRWQFQGGKVILDILISVYVLEGFKSFAKTLAVILEHEFLHVHDEIDIVSQFMPKAALDDQYVKQYLSQGKEVDDPMYQRWFVGQGFQNWLHDSVWAPEHNKRADARDSGPEWHKFRTRIDELQRSSN